MPTASRRARSPARRQQPSPAATSSGTAPTTDDHSQHLLNLACLAVAVRSTGDRAWAFLLPLFLSEASPSSLAPVSLHALSLSLGVVLFGPPLAQWLARHRSQSRAIVTLVILENTAMAMGGALLLLAASRMDGDESSNSSGHSGSSLTRSPLFGVALLLLAVDAAASSVLSLLIEKDVIARLFVRYKTTGKGGRDQHRSSISLEHANAAVTRADLATSVATYVLMGRLITDAKSAVAVLATWHVIAAALVLTVLHRLRTDAPELQRTSKAVQASPSFARLLMDGPRTLAALEAAPRLLLCAFVVLFFTCLSPSGLLTAALRSRGVSASTLAYFRALAQLCGALGTGIAPRVIARRGPLQAGTTCEACAQPSRHNPSPHHHPCPL